jgi:hypothetical protein
MRAEEKESACHMEIQAMDGFLPALRQKTFPPEFRIDSGRGNLWEESLTAAMAEAVALLKAGPSKGSEKPENSEAPPQPGLDRELALALCDHHFRLHRNAEQLADGGGDSKELRSIRRTLESLNELLVSHGIEYRDPTGQAYDFLRLDFEQIGEPELVPGLDGLKVWRCERPAVLMNGALIRKARGVVAKPA